MMEQLNTLFSMTLVCDRNLVIIDISAALKEQMPGLAAGDHLTEAFAFNRPASVRSVEDIEDNQHSLFLLVSHDDQFALRGQMLCMTLEGEERVVFAGSPWLIWLNNNRPELQLGLKDFAPADAQMDQLFYMSTERQMVGDLEKLNEELLEAKREVEAAQAEKNAFYAQMSHEMRTPLNGVASALALLVEQDLPAKASELVTMAHRSSGNLLRVINYVLDVARLETGTFDDQAETLELQQVFDSVLDIVRPRTLGRKLELVAIIDSGIPSHYSGLKERLHQVLLNLASNAVKFTEAGRITLHAKPATEPCSTVRIEVIDTGEGIDPFAIANIFKPFYTSSPKGAVTQETGTGLGLDIVRRNVQVMGGTLGVDSKPGQGSTFWLELPLEPELPPAETEDQAAKPASERPLAGHVLLVEDNETNRMLCTMLLEGLGVSVSTEGSGEDAIAAIERDKPDLVFMDIGLPGMDGHAASKQLRQRFDSEALPIVALTAYASSHEQEKSVAAGMNDYLIKPVGKDQFRECLLRWLPNAPAGEDIDRESRPEESTLQELESQIGADNLRKVILRFCDEAATDMKAVLAAEDNTTLAKTAHALISTCDSFALPMLAERFRAIEENAREGKLATDIERAQLASQLQAGLQALRQRVA